MRAAVLTLITCLLVSYLNGQQARSNKCWCEDKGVRSLKHIKSFDVFPETQFCGRMEILVRISASLRRCVDPASRLGQRLLTKWNKTHPTFNGHMTA